MVEKKSGSAKFSKACGRSAGGGSDRSVNRKAAEAPFPASGAARTEVAATTPGTASRSAPPRRTKLRSLRTARILISWHPIGKRQQMMRMRNSDSFSRSICATLFIHQSRSGHQHQGQRSRPPPGCRASGSFADPSARAVVLRSTIFRGLSCHAAIAAIKTAASSDTLLPRITSRSCLAQSPCRWVNTPRWTMPWITGTDYAASRNPSAPPAPASSTTSAAICEISRARLAPRAISAVAAELLLRTVALRA